MFSCVIAFKTTHFTSTEYSNYMPEFLGLFIICLWLFINNGKLCSVLIFLWQLCKNVWFGFFFTFFSKIIFKLSSFYHKLLGEMLDSNVAKPHVTVSLIILLNYDAFIFQISYFWHCKWLNMFSNRRKKKILLTFWGFFPLTNPLC